MTSGAKTIDEFKKIWPNIEVAKGEVVNQDFEKGSIEYIEPGQDNYVYRCRDCALGGFAAHNVGKWRPLYYSGKYYKSSTYKTHLDSCKGKANSSQPILPHIFKNIGTKRQREELGAQVQRKEYAMQGMLMSFELVELIAKQELSMTKRIPLLSWGDSLLEHGSLTKHWRGKNYTQTMLPFICNVLRDHNFAALREGAMWSIILDESTDITFSKNLCILAKSGKETKFIGNVALDDGKGINIARSAKEIIIIYGIPLENCCGIGSDGASCMTGKFNGFGHFWQEMVRDSRGNAGINDKVIQVHCVSHRVALAVTDAYSQVGEVGQFLASVDQLCRVAYSFFSRSTMMRKEYMKLQSTFSNLKLPNSLCETRWVGRYRCIATLDDCGKQVQQFIDGNFRLKNTVEGGFIRTFYKDHLNDLHDLRRILRRIWRLSQRTQQDDLSLWKAYVYALTTQGQISELSGMGSIGKKLAKVFVSMISKRFTVDDARAVMPFEFPVLTVRGEKFMKCEVKKAISQLVRRNSYHFQQVNKVLFKSLYINYRKCELFAIENHVQCLRDVINSIYQELSPSFIKLVDIVNCLPASSAVAERVFSVQNRIKTKYRNRLSMDVLNQLMTVRLLESPKRLGVEASEQWWSSKRRRYCRNSDRNTNEKSLKQLSKGISQDDDLFLDSDDSEDETYVPAPEDEFITDDDSDWYEDIESGDEEVCSEKVITWPKLTGQSQILYESDISDGWENDSDIDS